MLITSSVRKLTLRRNPLKNMFGLILENHFRMVEFFFGRLAIKRKTQQIRRGLLLFFFFSNFYPFPSS